MPRNTTTPVKRRQSTRRQPTDDAPTSSKKRRLDESNGRSRGVFMQDVFIKTRAISSHSQLVSRSRSESPSEPDVNTDARTLKNENTTTIYAPEDEDMEVANLQVIGETPGDYSDDDDVPVRVLSEFTIYNRESMELVDVSRLFLLDGEEESAAYGASGIVERYIDEDDEDESSSEENSEVELSSIVQRVTLSPILEFNINWVSVAYSGEVTLDPKIYIRTCYAWYILDTPSPTYRPYFQEFWVRHAIFCHLVVASLDTPTIKYNEFSESFAITYDAMRVIRRELTLEDLESDEVQSYVLATLDELCAEHVELRRALHRVPLMRTLRGDSATASSKQPVISSVPRDTKSGTSAKDKKKSHKDVEKDVLKHRNPTTVTPLVMSIAERLFPQPLTLEGRTLKQEWNQESDDEAEAYEYIHEGNPVSIEWDTDSRVAPHHYSTVYIDGVKYSVGDAVIVEKGEDSNGTRERNAASEPARSLNNLANTKWFAVICYMFEKEEKVGKKVVYQKYFHAQWLQHGSQMLLQEAAHPNGLFYLNECDNLSFGCIYQRCNLRVLAPLEDEPPEEPDCSCYHTGLTWDQTTSAFTETSTDAKSAALACCKPWRRCLPCGLTMLQKRCARWIALPDGGFSWHGVAYHNHDFVYVRPPGRQYEVYLIVQIVEFNFDQDDDPGNEGVHVRQYGRYDQIVHSLGGNNKTFVRDDRRLFKTDTITTVDLSSIHGKVFVICPTSSEQIAEWTTHDDHFYADRQAPTPEPRSLNVLKAVNYDVVQPCLKCYGDRLHEFQEQKCLLQKHGRLQGLELFAGAGGLSTGFDMSGFVETKWMVEFSPSAALTYKANHPDTIVYNQCSNLLLSHALSLFEGKTVKPLHDLQEGPHCKQLPPLPKPGEVDFIYGGPPCQGYSRMNHHRKVDDVRNTLVCNMLSYVEFYRPSYFLLENVVGLFSFPLGGEQKGQAIVGGIKMGVVKFIIRTLVCLGYQVHFKILQAGQYGAPQDRRRIIFWGARRNVPLPSFPVPLHWFPKSAHAHKLPTGDVLYPPSRAIVFHDGDKADYHQCAPLPPVTVEDAIGDLPPFDWINPHLEIEMTDEDEEELGNRLAMGIHRYHASTPSAGQPFPGFSCSVPYVHDALTRYQRMLRDEDSNTISYHYTRRCAVNVVERVTSLPIKRNADHVDLPMKLRINRLFRQDQARPDYRGMYGRVDGQGAFHTAMTTVAPNAKGGRVIHPTQKRIVSVRECARFQGFPDRYQFLSASTSTLIADQHRQIGNAVPVPVALALGKELGKVLLEYWSKLELQEAVERENSPDVVLDSDKALSPEL